MKFRKFFTKALLLVLISSLLFIGFGNIILTNEHKSIVAKVGKEKISLQEYTTIYNHELQYIQKLLNRPLTDEQINEFDIKGSILNKLIEKKALTNFIHDLNLRVGQESITNYTKNIKHFQNQDGHFDKQKFQEALKNANLSEDKYVSDLELIFPLMISMNSLFDDENDAYLHFTPELIKKIYQSRHQSRIVDIISVNKSAVHSLPKPQENELKDIYEKNKSNFISPEYRTINYLEISNKDFIKDVKITEEEVEKFIKDHDLVNQRDIINLVFTNLEDAQNAFSKIKSGMTFENVVTDIAKTTLDNITLKNITKDMLPEELKNNIFSLKENEVSGIIKSMFGWHIIKIKSIHPISNKDLAVLKINISDNMVKQKAIEQLNKNINTINNKIDGGASLEEIASLYNLELKTMGPIDINGTTSAGEKIKDLNRFGDIIESAFANQIHKLNHFSGDGMRYFNTYVTNITPSYNKTFEQSKDEVEKIWQHKFITDSLFKIASENVIKLKNGEKINNTQGISLISNQKIYRNEVAQIENPQQDYPNEFVNNIFNIGKDNTTDPAIYKDQVIVAVLRAIQNPTETSEVMISGLKTELLNNNVEALKDQFLRYLIQNYPVEVNKSLIASIK